MELKSLSNEALVDQTKTLVKEEKALTQKIIEHLEEVERKKLDLEKGYSSLFSFCTDELGYCAGSAQIRIEAMRVLKSLPSLEKEKLKAQVEKGEVSLSNLAQVGSFVRREELSLEQTQELIEESMGLSLRELEKKLVSLAPESLSQEKMRSVTETHTELKVIVDEETLTLLEEFKAKTAHQNPYGKSGEAVKLALKLALKQVDPEAWELKKKKKSSALQTRTLSEIPKASSLSISLHPDEVIRAKRSRFIPKPLKIELWKKAQGQCEYQDPQTQKRCASRYQLEVDHIHPYSKGGPTQLLNLQLLCRAHNQYFGPRTKSK